MKTNLTFHAQFERIDRAVEILSRVGIGEPIAERVDYDTQGRYNKKVLTDLGIVLIYNKRDELITLYLATIAQAKRFYQGMSHMPQHIYNVVKKNQIRYAAIFTMK